MLFRLIGPHAGQPARRVSQRSTRAGEPASNHTSSEIADRAPMCITRVRGREVATGCGAGHANDITPQPRGTTRLFRAGFSVGLEFLAWVCRVDDGA